MGRGGRFLPNRIRLPGSKLGINLLAASPGAQG